MDEPLEHMVVQVFRPEDQEPVRTLILAGLEGRWGRLDGTLNGDLDDIAVAYTEGVTLTAWLGDDLVGTGTVVFRGDGLAEVLRMSTASSHRRRGIARRSSGETPREARLNRVAR